MFLLIAIGMILTGGLFFYKASRMKQEPDSGERYGPGSRRMIELQERQRQNLRKMGFLSIILGAALLAVNFIYLS